METLKKRFSCGDGNIAKRKSLHDGNGDGPGDRQTLPIRCRRRLQTGEPGLGLERVKGIEPSYEAWEAAVLPLNYTRISVQF
jgi:hypothetical protein